MSRKPLPGRLRRGFSLVALGALMAAACAFGAPPAATAAVTPTVSALTSPDPAVPEATTPALPVTLLASPQGGYLPTVNVSINGSTPVPMMIDEGTSFLVAFPHSIVDPTTPVVETGIPQSIQYDGTAASGQIARGTVTLTTTSGSVSSPQQVAFLDAASCTPHCLGSEFGDRIQGVIGIAQSKNATKNIDPINGLYSTLAQLGPSLSTGYTIDFTADQPAIQLGTPTAAADGDTPIQRADQGGLTYPTGQLVYKPPVICWSISLGTAAGSECKNTVLDTGQSTGKLNGRAFDPVVAPVASPSNSAAIGRVAAGAVIDFSVSETSAPFARLASTGSIPHEYDQFPVMRSATANYFNAGNDFYLSHIIGFDNDAGMVIIHAATGAPAQPSELPATAGDGMVTVGWQVPEPSPGPPLTGYIVTVRTADGSIFSTTTITNAQDTQARIGGLTNGVPYQLAVAAVNQLTIGSDATMPGTVIPEAQSPSGTPTIGGGGIPPAGGSSGDHIGGAPLPNTLSATGSIISPWWPSLAALSIVAGIVGLAISRRLKRTLSA